MFRSVIHNSKAGKRQALRPREKSGRMRASFTVEAALLMTLLLPVIVSIIYASFFLHDRALMQGAACELTAMGSTLAEETDREGRLTDLEKKLVTARLLGTEYVKSSFFAGKDRIFAEYQGTFRIPGLILSLFTGGSLEIKRSWSREVFHPADTIRMVRGLEYMLGRR